MEQRRILHFLVAIVFCAATAALTYSMGHQAGERETRGIVQRSALERRMAMALDKEQDMFVGDEIYEDDGDGLIVKSLGFTDADLASSKQDAAESDAAGSGAARSDSARSNAVAPAASSLP